MSQNRVVLEAVDPIKPRRCDGCFFEEIEIDCMAYDKEFPCLATNRTDGRGVIWVIAKSAREKVKEAGVAEEFDLLGR